MTTELMGATATYSPDDNKLRLYPVTRLDKATYDRVRAAGFRWAPKQELFVAPMWTPDREDLLTELCGEVGDDDSSLVERAEERADRFDDYSAKRMQDAESARCGVSAIADNIPFGQPILVGHHSERRARKDAEKIDNGIRKAVQMWKTSKYWTDRAAGALRHAGRKERPDVRARRIKKIESDRRRQEKIVKEASARVWLWTDPVARLRKKGEPVTLVEAVLFLAGDSRILETATPEEVCARGIAKHQARIEWAQRWIEHYDNRLAYERAMLDDAGGTASDKTGPEVGGAVQCWASPRGGWSYIRKVNKVTVTVQDNWGNGGANFTRNIPFDKLAAVMSKAAVDEERAEGVLIETDDKTGFYIATGSVSPAPSPAEATTDDAAFRAMEVQIRDAARAGKPVVEIIAVPQLFVTPAPIVARMIDEAKGAFPAWPGKVKALEPSAGTGAIATALRKAGADVTCCEQDPRLGAVLSEQGFPTVAGDFIERFSLFDPVDDVGEVSDEMRQFDVVVMNPPFANGVDIKHIQHAFKLLKPGGRLVALCANGPRQQAKLGLMVEEHGGTWEDLPDGSFAQAGTNVRVALLVVDRPAA